MNYQEKNRKYNGDKDMILSEKLNIELLSKGLPKGGDFEIAECIIKKQLHVSKIDTMDDYITKIENLGHLAIEFADFLKRKK